LEDAVKYSIFFFVTVTAATLLIGCSTRAVNRSEFAAEAKQQIKDLTVPAAKPKDSLAVYSDSSRAHHAKPDTTKGFEADTAIVSAGRGAVVSGLDGFIQFRDSLEILSFQANNQRTYIMYGHKFSYMKAFISGGFFEGTPWLGPRLDLMPADWLYVILWHGWQAGSLGVPDWKVNYLFSYAGAYFTLKGVTLGYAIQNFQGKLMHLPEINYVVAINNRFAAKVGWTYKATRNENGISLFRIELGCNLK
jgi:hypothetical protein